MSGAGETGALGGFAVDRLRLRPLPALRWHAPSLGEPGIQYEVVAGEQRVELGLGEEVNQEPSLRAGEVADGEAAVAVRSTTSWSYSSSVPTAFARRQKRPPGASRAWAARK
jgi:hypothetical protein